jgi:hypothetical protein
MSLKVLKVEKVSIASREKAAAAIKLLESAFSVG